MRIEKDGSAIEVRLQRDELQKVGLDDSDIEELVNTGNLSENMQDAIAKLYKLSLDKLGKQGPSKRVVRTLLKLSENDELIIRYESQSMEEAIDESLNDLIEQLKESQEVEPIAYPEQIEQEPREYQDDEIVTRVICAGLIDNCGAICKQLMRAGFTGGSVYKYKKLLYLIMDLEGKDILRCECIVSEFENDNGFNCMPEHLMEMGECIIPKDAIKVMGELYT